jgi:hypothetical protein
VEDLAMARWFVEYECDTLNGRLLWMPLYLDAPDERAAAEMSRGVEAALGERYSVTRSAPPRPAVSGQSSGLLAVHAALGHTGRRMLLDPRSWELRAVPGRPPVDLSAHIELRVIPAHARVEQTQGLAEPRLVPVRELRSESLSQAGMLLMLAVGRRAAAGGAG